MDWHTFDSEPDSDIAALVYFGNIDVEWSGVLSGVRLDVERFGTAWFANGDWFEAGTGHKMFEIWREGPYLPTHWAPLPPRP